MIAVIMELTSANPADHDVNFMIGAVLAAHHPWVVAPP
jgi:hypothetical protein